MATKTVTTLKREVMANGRIRLSSPNGIVDKRNGAVYSEVICKAQSEKYFIEAESGE